MIEAYQDEIIEKMRVMPSGAQFECSTLITNWSTIGDGVTKRKIGREFKKWVKNIEEFKIFHIGLNPARHDLYEKS